MSYKDSKKQREAQKEWKKKRLQLVQDLKRRPCQDCGGSFLPACMQFDHIPGRGEKFKDISKMMYYNLDKLYEEISKCELVCANCHALRTYYRQQALYA